MSNQNIAIIGASGGLGSAFVRLFSGDLTNTVHAFSRSKINTNLANVYLGRIDYSSEESIKKAADQCTADAPLNLIIIATGILHEQELQPEKSLRDLSTENFERAFLVNTIGPALVAKHFLPKIQRNEHTTFAVLSARVGSIADNQLGGWYAYRASKAALNMLVKTISLEISRNQAKTIVAGLHPGTVATELSKPFQKNVPNNKLFCPDYSAKQLASVLTGLTLKDSGKIFAWDATEIPY